MRCSCVVRFGRETDSFEFLAANHGLRYVLYTAAATMRAYRREMWRRMGDGYTGFRERAEAEIAAGIELGIVNLP